MSTKCQRLKPKQSIVNLAISRFVSEIHGIIISSFIMKILSVLGPVFAYILRLSQLQNNYKINFPHTTCVSFAALLVEFKIKLFAKTHIEVHKWNSGFSTRFA